MPVEFGSPHRHAGRHWLAEHLEWGFWLYADVELVPLWQTIDRTCERFPRRRALLGSKGPLPFYPAGYEAVDPHQTYEKHGHMLTVRRIGFGPLASEGDSFSTVHGLSWLLDISGDRPKRHLRPSGRLAGGRIEDLPSMEAFLNSLETNLRELDPGASIRFASDDADAR